ncbi:MAG: MerR family transcriptional regulator [Gammaproteobacteria bacterium]|nr:MerR family transcriptional regulator [Gammaproteobacteria bacterium]
MLAMRSYSITELQQLSGFDRRTIVYYLQQGLIPRAGRRGPNTRYPQDALLRLRFIRGVKTLQDQGRCGTVTLREIGGLLDRLASPELARLVEHGMPPEEVDALLRQATPADAAMPPTTGPAPASTPPAEPATPPAPAASAQGLLGPSGPRRSYGLADAGIRQRPTPPPAPQPALHPPPDAATPAVAAQAADPATTPSAAGAAGDLGQLLRELELRPAMAGRRLSPGASEQWTEIPITSRIYLSVRGLAQDDAPLADAAARELKRILRAR